MGALVFPILVVIASAGYLWAAESKDGPLSNWSQRLYVEHRVWWVVATMAALLPLLLGLTAIFAVVAVVVVSG